MLKTIISVLILIPICLIGVKIIAIVFWGELFRQLEYRMSIKDVTIEEVEDDAVQRP